MVGRHQELERLVALAKDVVDGNGSGVAVLVGDPGVGKSRLVEELTVRARALGVHVLEGGAEALESGTPYFPWRRVIEALLRSEASTQPRDWAALAGAAVADLGPTHAGLSPLLTEALALPTQDSDRTAVMSGHGRAVMTQRLIAALIAATASRRPTLVLLQDAHWFDSATWALLRATLEQVEGVGVVIATRPLDEQRVPEYRWLLTEYPRVVVPLKTLDRQQSGELVRRRLVPAEPSAEELETIWQRAGGNPLFIEELCHALRQPAASASPVGAALGVSHMQELKPAAHLAGSVQGLIVSRIGRLPQREQLVLQVASVAGRHFAAELVGGIYPVAEGREAVAESLPALVARDLLRAEQDSDETFEFKHALTHEAVYGLIVDSQRRDLHGEVARWYERQENRVPAAQYGILAHHWREAEHWDEAVRYFDLAGHDALGRYSNREAVAHFNEAVELNARHATDSHVDTQRRWYLGLAESHHRLGDITACRRWGGQAMRLAGAPLARSSLGQLASIARSVALRLLHRWWPAAVRTHDPEEQRRRLGMTNLLNRLTEVHLYREEALAGLDRGLREINMAQAAGAPGELARACAMMSVVLGSVPLRGIAGGLAERALREVQGQPLNSAVAFAHSRAGVYQIYVANWPEAERNQQAALDIADSIGDPRLREETMAVIGLYCLYAGRYAENDGMWSGMRAAARHSGNEQTYCWAHVTEAGGRLRQGRAGEALALIEPVMEWVVFGGNTTEKALGHGLTALAHLRLGDLERALASADLTLPHIVGSRPVAYWIGHIYAALVEVYVYLWRHALWSDEPVWQAREDELRSKTQRTCAALRTFGGIFPFGRPASLLWTGVVRAMEGRESAALRSLRQAVEEATRLKMPYEAGLAHRELASLLLGSDPERKRRLEQACAVLEEIGAKHDLEQARALLDAA